MPLNSVTIDFLQSAFGTKWEHAQIICVKCFPGTKEWGQIRETSAKDARPLDDDAVYVSTSLFKPGTTRSDANIETVHILTVDDVGTRIDKDLVDSFCLLFPASWRIESSAGNWQYQWHFPDGITVEEHTAKWAAMEEAFGVLHGKAHSQPFRAPQGVNGKDDRPGRDFRVHGEKLGGGYRGSDLPSGTPTTKTANPGKDGPQQAPSLEALRAIMKKIPNDWDGAPDSNKRARWELMVKAIRGCSRAFPEEARLVAEDWSGPHEKDFDRVWESQYNVHSAGWGTLEIEAKKFGWSEADVARLVFDDGEEPEPEEPMDLTAFVLEPPKSLTRRPWIYGRRLVRGYVSTTVAAGGVGKSSLTLVEALAMVSGKDLLGVGADRMPKKPQRVWIWNGEDPMAEMKLRVGAACLHYGLNAADLADRLYVDSGRDKPIKLAMPSGKGIVVNEALVRKIIAGVKARRVDVLIIDPLVSAHFASENDNMQMDLVIKTIGRIAEECGCAVELVHHSRKSNGERSEATVDDARGASAVINAARNLRVLSPMTKQMGTKYGIPNYRSYFCASKDATKTNLTPPLDSDHWYRMASVDLGNGDAFDPDGPVEGDNIGVAEKWSLMITSVDRADLVAKVHGSMAGKQWRHHENTGQEWIGNPVAEALGVDILDKREKTNVRETIEIWIKKGWLRKVQGFKDNRHPTWCVEIGDAPEVVEEVF